MLNISDLIFKTAEADDFKTLVDMRVKFVLDIHPSDDNDKIETLRIESEKYLNGQIRNNNYLGILGYYKNQVITCGGILFYKLPPMFDDYNRRIGHLLNIYTIPEYRKLGVGKMLMDYIILKSKEMEIKRLFLNATKAGEFLYKKCGFIEPEEKAMILNF